MDVDLIDRAQRVTPLSAVQNIYSMVERDMEHEVIPYCLEHGIGVVHFSPIASGLLSGKITVNTRFESYDDVRLLVRGWCRAPAFSSASADAMPRTRAAVYGRHCEVAASRMPPLSAPRLPHCNARIADHPARRRPPTENLGWGG